MVSSEPGAVLPGTLPELIAVILPNLRAHFDPDRELDRQYLKFAEEVFEFLEAFDEWRLDEARGRRHMAGELSDAIITLHICAAIIDVPVAPSVEQTPSLVAGAMVLKLAIAAGHVTGAYNRWAGHSRRYGPKTAIAEAINIMADVTYATAASLRIDLDDAWRDKASIILTRGWRDKAPATITDLLGDGDGC